MSMKWSIIKSKGNEILACTTVGLNFENVYQVTGARHKNCRSYKSVSLKYPEHENSQRCEAEWADCMVPAELKCERWKDFEI